MIYKEFGKTGEKISTLGFGCMRFPEYEQDGVWYVEQDKVNEMIKRAVEGGVNYFDTAYYYCHSNSEAALGTAIKPYRDKVMIATKFPVGEVNERSDYRKYLNTSLERLQTDHIDFYHFWGINKTVFDEKIVGLGLLDEALKAKEEGLIKHISFSFHDDPQNIKYIIDEAKIMETMLIQYNLLDRTCEDMIEYAASAGLGVVAMGPVGGGRLAAPTGLSELLLGDSVPTYELAFKFVIANPNISCALSGMENIDMVNQNIEITSDKKPLTAEEWAKITASIDGLKKFNNLYCTGCAYCQPCPKKINIPAIFNIYTHHNVYGLTEVAKKEFQGYIGGEHPGATVKDCVDCGFCEKKCPQKLEIRRLLHEVEDTLVNL